MPSSSQRSGRTSLRLLSRASTPPSRLIAPCSAARPEARSAGSLRYGLLAGDKSTSPKSAQERGLRAARNRSQFASFFASAAPQRRLARHSMQGHVPSSWSSSSRQATSGTCSVTGASRLAATCDRGQPTRCYPGRMAAGACAEWPTSSPRSLRLSTIADLAWVVLGDADNSGTPQAELSRAALTSALSQYARQQRRHICITML